MIEVKRLSRLHEPTQEIDRVGCRDHFVQFYHDEQTLVDCVARFFAVGFAQGNVAISVATREHRSAIESALADLGVDVERLLESGDYSPFDAREMLSHFMVGGAPNPQRFRALLGNWMDAAAISGTGIRAYGEMVALLCADENEAGAIQLEKFWNDLGETHEFSLFCGYPSAHFAQTGKANYLSDVCRAHSRVITG